MSAPARARLSQDWLEVTLTDWALRSSQVTHEGGLCSLHHSDTFLPGLTKYQRHKLCGIKPPLVAPILSGDVKRVRSSIQCCDLLDKC